MRSMDIEASQQKVRQKASYPSVSVVGHQDSVFSEILNSFGSFGPEFLESVSTEKDSIIDESKKSIDEHMKLQSVPEVSTYKIEQHQDVHGDEVPEFWLLLFDDGNNDDFEKEVEGLEEQERKHDDGFSVPFVLGLVPQEVADGLQSSCFIVKFQVGVYVVTNAVHDLPLVVSEASCAVEILEDVIFVVDEVVSDPHHSDEEEGAEGAEDVGEPRCVLGVDAGCSQQQGEDQESQDDDSRSFGLSFVLDFFHCHFFEHFPLDCSVEAVFFEREPGDLLFGFSNVVLGQDFSDFWFVEMVNDEQFSDVLPFGHLEPHFASRVPVDETAEIVQFVFDHPEATNIGTPQLPISFPLFVHPDVRVAVESSCRQCFPIRLNFIDLHSVFVLKVDLQSIGRMLSYLKC